MQDDKFCVDTSRVKRLHPYKPGEQLTGDYIKLNANESPYPAPASLLQKVSLFVQKDLAMQKYPDPDSCSLRAKIAQMLNSTGGVLSRATTAHGGSVSPSPIDALPFSLQQKNIYVGNGSDEVLSFLFYGFCEKACVTSELTYSFYPVYCSYYDVPLIKVPLCSCGSLPFGKIDLQNMLLVARQNDAMVIFANPNAPTGTPLSRAEVAESLKAVPINHPIIIDEAYCDFGAESCIPLIKDFPNLIIVRTFSKSLCAAGMRLGYAVSNQRLVSTIFTVKNCVNHFPVDSLAQFVGCSIIDELPYYVECAKKIVAERCDFVDFLKGRGVEVLPSATNFVLAKFKMAGKAVYEALKAHGVLVRYFDDLPDFVRITIGDASNMKALKSAIDASCV